MHRGSLPTTRKRHSCHLCSVVEKKLIKIPGSKPKSAPEPKKALVHFKKKKENVFKKKKPKKVPTSKRLEVPSTKKLDMFFDQEGGGKLITPVRAIVEQAKALLRKKWCRKGCRQVGARVSRRSRRKVYNPNRRTRNPKRTTKKSKRTKKSKYGRNVSARPFYFKTKN